MPHEAPLHVTHGLIGHCSHEVCHQLAQAVYVPLHRRTAQSSRLSRVSSGLPSKTLIATDLWSSHSIHRRSPYLHYRVGRYETDPHTVTYFLTPCILKSVLLPISWHDLPGCTVLYATEPIPKRLPPWGPEFTRAVVSSCVCSQSQISGNDVLNITAHPYKAARWQQEQV
jgi:hypothetical protein